MAVLSSAPDNKKAIALLWVSAIRGSFNDPYTYRGLESGESVYCKKFTLLISKTRALIMRSIELGSGTEVECMPHQQ